jgi:hypothetical protein
MNLSALSQSELQERCSWCHRVIGEDEERFGGGTKVRSEAKSVIAGLDGKLIPMRLEVGREFIAIIPAVNSPARAAGHDVYFQTCSQECCDELSKAIRDEIRKKA